MARTAEPSSGPTCSVDEIWGRYGELTAFASNSVRTSALAGLAAAWLFSGLNTGDLSKLSDVSNGIVLAGVLFSLSLASDILQYYVGAICWKRLATKAEKGGFHSESAVPVPKSTNYAMTACYNAKVWLLFAGFLTLAVVFARALD